MKNIPLASTCKVETFLGRRLVVAVACIRLIQQELAESIHGLWLSWIYPTPTRSRLFRVMVRVRVSPHPYFISDHFVQILFHAAPSYTPFCSSLLSNFFIRCFHEPAICNFSFSTCFSLWRFVPFLIKNKYFFLPGYWFLRSSSVGFQMILQIFLCFCCF